MEINRFAKRALPLAMFGLITHAHANQTDEPVVLPSLTMTVYGQQLPTAVFAISEEELRRQGVANMADIVKYQPLVSAPNAITGASSVWNGSGTTGYNIRGMDGNRVGLDVDGVELPHAGSLPDGQSNNHYGIGRDYIEPELFKSVRIQAGSTDSHSDGLAGRVSFVSKSPSDYVGADKRLAGGYKASFFGADETVGHTAHMAVGNDKVSGLVVYAKKDGKAANVKSAVATNRHDWTSESALAKVEISPNDSHQLTLTGEQYKKDGTLDFDEHSVSMRALYPEGGVQKSLVERTRFGVEYKLSPEDFAFFDSLNTALYYQDSKNETQTHAHYVNSRTKDTAQRYFETSLNTKTQGAKLTAQKQLGRHKVVYGAEVSKTDESRPWTQYQTSQAGTTINKNNRMPSMQTEKMAVYVSDFIKLDKLTLTPQLRYVYQIHTPTDLSDYLTQSPISQSIAKTEIKETKDDYLSPGLTVSYQASPDLLIYGKYNKSARLPTSSEKAGAYDGGRMYAVIGNPNLKAETANAFELGFKTDAWRGLSLAVGGFYNQYKDYIEYRQVQRDQIPAGYSTLIRSQNINDVDIWGGELIAKVNLGEWLPKSDGFGVALAYGVSDYDAKDDMGKATYLDSVLPQKGTLGLTYDAPTGNYGLALTTTAVKGKRSGASADHFRVGGYHVQDLSTYWNVSPNVRVNVGLNNIFNKKYWDYSTASKLMSNETIKIERSAQPERHVSASVELKF